MQCEACGHANLDGARFCANCGALLPTANEGPDPMIGQLVGGRFRVTAVLGEGGMGIVYVGEQQMGSTVRKVAIKTLHQHLSKDPSVLARFHRECGTVAQLEHPNTIKFYDFGSTSDGTLYIAMEFVAGRSLAEVIRDEGPLEPARVTRILRQACGALDEAHEKGIIHRDLKPENLILTNRAGDKDFVKVLDFGIAARSESADAQKEQKLTQQGMVLGTPPYMSPEQFTGKALDLRSDIYSLGVMTYEMLTSRLPFDADTPWQWATQHMTAQPIAFEVSAPSKSIPPGMRQAILKALSKDREKRQSTAREFFTELSEGGHVTVDAPPPAAALASTGTAAMDQVPEFRGTEASPARAPLPVPVGTPVGVVAHVPPSPTTSRKKSGGKGLIVGLGALGTVLLVAMAVVAARSLKQDEEVQPLPIGDTSPTPASSGGVTTIAPVETAPPTPTSVAAPEDPTTPPVTGTPTPPPKTKPSTATGTGTAASTPKPPAGGGCDACISQASSGNVLAAAQSARSCTDAAGKQNCLARIKGNAPNAARAAAYNGDCRTANLIVGAAESIGASTPALKGALAKTSCK
jgi:serine/threonine-protein kinase